MARAEDQARRLAGKDAIAFASIKGLIRGPIADEMRRRRRASVKEFADIWYSEATWKRLKKNRDPERMRFERRIGRQSRFHTASTRSNTADQVKRSRPSGERTDSSSAVSRTAAQPVDEIRQSRRDAACRHQRAAAAEYASATEPRCGASSSRTPGKSVVTGRQPQASASTTTSGTPS